jgi:hypothetical protein
MNFFRGCAIASVAAVFGSAPALATTVFNFANFNNCTTLQVNGNAACTGGVLRVTPANFGQSGSAFSTTLIPLGAGAQFSTFFSFNINGSGGSSDGDGLGADGIVFVVQPVSSSVGGAGGGIGYQGIPTSLGVEFDTWNNGSGAGDPDGNHVGIDLNGSVFSVLTAGVSPRLNNATTWYAWIDYDGTTLTLRLSQTASRPATPTLSYAVNLATILGTTSAYVGFTSGTGAAFANHDILTWQFDNAFAPIGGPPTLAAPIPTPTMSDAALLTLALMTLAAGWLGLRRRRR